jgi:hypothetical protein
MSYPIDFPGIKFREAQPNITATQAAQGRANLHIGNPGGVDSSGAGFSLDVGLPASSDLHLAFEFPLGLAHGGAAQRSLFGTASAFAGGVWCVMGNTGALIINENGGSNTTVFGTIPAGARYLQIGYASASRTFTAWADGYLVGTATRFNTDVLNPLKYILGAWAVVGLSVNTTCRCIRIFNRALTTDERAAVMRGETPAGLAHPTFVPQTAPIQFGSGLIGTPSGQTTTSCNFLATATADGYIYGNSANAYPVLVGQQIRLTWDMTVTGGTLSSVQAAGWENNGFNIGITGPLVSASNVGTRYTATMTVATAPATSFFGVRLGGVLNGMNIAVTNFTTERLGTVADYRPGNVLHSGKWIDSSPNCYDLIPVAGITPLNPIAASTRAFTGTLTASLPGLGAGGFNEVTPIIASTDPAYASVRLGDVTHVTFASVPPTGVYIRGGVNATANGQVTVALSSTDEDAQTLTTVPVSVTHIIK